MKKKNKIQSYYFEENPVVIMFPCPMYLKQTTTKERTSNEKQSLQEKVLVQIYRRTTILGG